jgi:hypothetical protein
MFSHVTIGSSDPDKAAAFRGACARAPEGTSAGMIYLV